MEVFSQPHASAVLRSGKNAGTRLIGGGAPEQVWTFGIPDHPAGRIVTVNDKGKRKVHLEQATKTQRGSRGIALLFL